MAKHHGHFCSSVKVPARAGWCVGCGTSEPCGAAGRQFHVFQREAGELQPSTEWACGRAGPEELSVLAMLGAFPRVLFVGAGNREPFPSRSRSAVPSLGGFRGRERAVPR